MNPNLCELGMKQEEGSNGRREGGREGVGGGGGLLQENCWNLVCHLPAPETATPPITSPAHNNHMKSQLGWVPIWWGDRVWVSLTLSVMCTYVCVFMGGSLRPGALRLEKPQGQLFSWRAFHLHTLLPAQLGHPVMLLVSVYHKIPHFSPLPFHSSSPFTSWPVHSAFLPLMSEFSKNPFGWSKSMNINSCLLQKPEKKKLDFVVVVLFI